MTTKRLDRLPVTARAWTDGQLSGGQVEAICAQVDPATVEVFAAQEAALVPVLVGLGVDDTARAMAVWKARATANGEAPVEPDQALHLSSTFGDRWVLDGSLDSVGGQTVATALRVAETPDVESETARMPAQRRADALIDVCRFFLDHQHSHPGRHRPHVNVVVDLDDLTAGRSGRFGDGGWLDLTCLSTLLCDCALHRVITSGRSAVLDYGMTTRTIPAPLWNAIVIRDEHCRFPDCDRPSVWCEAHHVIWVEHNGPTCIDKLVLCCSRHHHRLHQSGWQAKLQHDGTLHVTDPHGKVRTTSPPRALPALC
jgi:hypothetical protein